MPPIGQCRVDPKAEDDAAERERQLLRAVGQGLLSGLPLAAGLTPAMQQAVIGAAAAAVKHGLERYGNGAALEGFLSRVLLRGAPLAAGAPGVAAVIDAARGAMGAYGTPILAVTELPPGGGGPSGPGGTEPPPPDPELSELLLEQVSLPTERELEILKELGRRGEYEIRAREVLEWQKGPRGATRRPRMTYPQWGRIPCTPGWDVIRQRLAAALIVEAAPAPEIPGFVSIPSWGLLGMDVHQRVQDLYFTTHAGNVVVADRRVRAGSRSYDLSQFAEHLPRPLIDHVTDDRLRVLDEALRFGSRSVLRADLVDMTANRVFELKPRSWAQAAVIQVWHYQACFNLAMGAMAGKTAPVAPYQPGRCDTPGTLLEGHWPARPVTIPLNRTGSLIAVVFHDPALPGVILYDVYRARNRRDEEKDQANQAHDAWPELAWLLSEILRRMGGRGGGSGSGEGGGEGGGGGGKVIPLRPGRPAPAPPPEEEWEVPAAAIVVVVVLVLIVLAILFLPEIAAALAVAAAAVGAFLLAAWEAVGLAELVLVLAELMGAAAVQLAQSDTPAGRDGQALAAVLSDARKALLATRARG